MNPKRIVIIFAFLIFCGCTSQKNLIYWQGAIPPLSKDSIFILRIHPGDILSINVFTINAEAYPYLSIPNERTSTDNRSAYEKGYIVNDSSLIKLPLIGAVNLNNLTIGEATKYIENKFKVFIDEPIVTIKKLNYKITVLGEVNKPGTYSVMNEKITLPEALGIAGDLTQFGDRKTVRIIRDEDGVRKDFLVDLTDPNSLLPSFYYIHPDDVIYVQSLKHRSFQVIGPEVLVITSILTTAAVILTLILTINTQ